VTTYVDDPLMTHSRTLRTGQRSEVWVAGIDGADPTLVLSTDALLLEAPNWAPDGGSLLLNGDGRLWRLDIAADTHGGLSAVEIENLPPINNDHVLDPPNDLIYLSANDGHIYVAPLSGGSASRITDASHCYHFLHGVSPDGSTLAFVELPRGDFSAAGRLALIPTTGGHISYPPAGTRHLDGPEFSPDGTWLYLNTEEWGTCPGHAQLARVPVDGGPLERLLGSDTVDWFPHLSPDGSMATYISFPTGTLGHPADLEVEVRLVSTDDWATPLGRFPLFGGQGTLNVNSWSPDGQQFAYVAYPVTEAANQ
jgi:TolB protein